MRNAASGNERSRAAANQRNAADSSQKRSPAQSSPYLHPSNPFCRTEQGLDKRTIPVDRVA